MTKYYDLHDEGESFVFQNDAVKLVFCAKTGILTEVTTTEITLTGAGLPQLLLQTGGYTSSSLDTERLNVNWARQTYVDTGIVGAESEYLDRKITMKSNGAELCVRSGLKDFILSVFYEVDDRPDIHIHYALEYTGSEPVRIRRAAGYVPCAQDLPELEWPGRSYPGEHRLDTMSPCGLSENLFDVLPDGEIRYVTDTCVILHDEDRVFSIYNTGLQTENNMISLVKTQERVAGRIAFGVSAVLESGESVSFGNVHLHLTGGCWWDETEWIGRRFEQDGCRVNPGTDRKMLKNLVIYETEIGIVQFRPDKWHSVYPVLRDLIDDLPRLRDLGYNCVQLMPAFPFPAYTVYDLHRPEWQHAYGEDLRALVGKAHALGMRVILDVLMHGIIDREIGRWDEKTYSSRKYYYPEWQKLCEWDVAPLRAQHPDWFVHQDDGSIFRVYTWSFNWANRGLQDWLAEALVKYVRDLDLDGFRFDAPTWVGASDWAPDNTHRPDRSLFAGAAEAFFRAREKVDRCKKDVIWLTEPESIGFRHSLDVAYTYSTQGRWGMLYKGKMNAAQLQDFYAIRKRVNPANALYVNWMDNHDSWNNGTVESGMYAYEYYSPVFARSMLALALFQEGAYMAYAGNEHSDAAYYARLLATRRREPVFREGDCSFENVHATDENVLCIEWQSGEEYLVVAINMCDHEVITGFAGVKDGVYTELLEGDDWNGRDGLSIPAGGCLLLKKQ